MIFSFAVCNNDVYKRNENVIFLARILYDAALGVEAKEFMNIVIKSGNYAKVKAKFFWV